MKLSTPPSPRLPMPWSASIRPFHLSLGGFLVTMMLLAGAASAQQTFDFMSNPLFKYLAGDWTGEGQGGSTGATLERFKVEWKARVSDGNAFTIEGAIKAADKTTFYKKTITRTDAGLFEAVVQPDTSKSFTQRYTVQVAPDGSRMEMTLLLTKKAKQVMADAFTGGGHDQLEYKLKFLDTSGAVTFSSTSVSKRVKKSAIPLPGR